MESQNEIGKSAILAGALIEKFEEGGLSRQLLEQLSNSKEALFKMIEAGTKELGTEVFFSVFFGEPVVSFILDVPEDYEHKNCFRGSEYFIDKGMLRAQGVDNLFDDETFPDVSQLVPGNRYEVVLYPVKSTIPYGAALEFVVSNGGLLKGPQGILAVLRYTKDSLPTGINIVAIDTVEKMRIYDKKTFSFFVRENDGYVHFNFEINSNDPSWYSLNDGCVIPVFKLID